MNKNSLNKIILIGRLGSDPEGRYTQQGRSVVSFSLATNESWTKAGNEVEHTEWHSIIAWDKLADFSKEFLYKGQLVSIEGSVRTRTWDDKKYPVKRKATDVLCTQIVPLEWKRDLGKSD
tara:strand:- start:101 stop:460 length:360 start_codon:yes stop_codon:yes gene_type:complete